MNKNDKIVHDLADRLHSIDACSIEQAAKSFVKIARNWNLRFCNMNELRQNANDNQVIGYFRDNELVCGLNQLSSTWDYLESDVNIIYCVIAQIKYNKHESFRCFRLNKDSEIYHIAIKIVKQFYNLRFNEILNPWKNIDQYMKEG